MRLPARLLGFVAMLGVLFGLGALAGSVIDPDREDDEATVAHAEPEGHGAMMPADPVRGLAVAANGLRLVVDDPDLQRGHRETLRFRIVDAHGETVRDFDVEHERRMHLIVARRDLSVFQHLHPVQGADGGWRVRLRLDDAGSYRLFADFSHEGTASTLADDLRVDGPADLQALPAPAPRAISDGGYAVRLATAGAEPGREADLRFTITKDGRTIQTEPYLGAGGHLVALREGDLAFLHVHPEDDGVGFAATFPTQGRYRLFLQFQHSGRVQTVGFTQEVA